MAWHLCATVDGVRRCRPHCRIAFGSALAPGPCSQDCLGSCLAPLPPLTRLEVGPVLTLPPRSPVCLPRRTRCACFPVCLGHVLTPCPCSQVASSPVLSWHHALAHHIYRHALASCLCFDTLSFLTRLHFFRHFPTPCSFSPD